MERSCPVYEDNSPLQFILGQLCDFQMLERCSHGVQLSNLVSLVVNFYKAKFASLDEG